VAHGSWSFFFPSAASFLPEADAGLRGPIFSPSKAAPSFPSFVVSPFRPSFCALLPFLGNCYQSTLDPWLPLSLFLVVQRLKRNLFSGFSRYFFFIFFSDKLWRDRPRTARLVGFLFLATLFLCSFKGFGRFSFSWLSFKRVFPKSSFFPWTRPGFLRRGASPRFLVFPANTYLPLLLSFAWCRS